MSVGPKVPPRNHQAVAADPAAAPHVPRADAAPSVFTSRRNSANDYWRGAAPRLLDRFFRFASLFTVSPGTSGAWFGIVRRTNRLSLLVFAMQRSTRAAQMQE